MNKKIKVYHVANMHGYSNWMNSEIVNNIEDADLIIFEGGEDLSPELYNEPKGEFTYTNFARDTKELKVYQTCIKLNKNIIGICRGNQALCVFSGGRLVQHQENPSYIHSINTYDGKQLMMSSTHHQAAYPYDMKPEEYKLLAWTEGISKFHLNGLNEEISNKPFKEVEAIYYPKTNCLGIQGHPEMIYGEELYKDTIEWCQELLNKFLNKEL